MPESKNLPFLAPGAKILRILEDQGTRFLPFLTSDYATPKLTQITQMQCAHP